MTRTKTLLVLVGLLFLGALYFFFNYSFLQITVDTDGDDTIEYGLLNQSDDNAKTVETQDTTIRKLVRHGSYEVSVRQNKTNGFLVAETGRWLRTTEVSMDLKPERSREFKGNNPLGCRNFLDGVVLSWRCYDAFEKGVLHAPATVTMPSVMKPLEVFGYSGGVVAGIAQIDGTTHALTRLDFDGGSVWTIYRVQARAGTLDQTKGRELAFLSPDKQYGVVNYKSGILIFDHNGDDFYYLPAVDGRPVKLPFARPSEITASLYSIDTDRDRLLLVYGESLSPEIKSGSLFLSTLPDTNGEGAGEESEELGLETGHMVVIDEDAQFMLPLEFGVTQARFCGDQTICTLHGSVLDIYDMSSGSLKKLYSINNVLQIESSGNSLLVVRNDGVLALDVLSGSGFFEYVFGDYEYCGIDTMPGQYLLCVDKGAGSPRDLSLLLIKRSEGLMGDEIDKQILRLAGLEEVESVAVYGRLIHIVPNIDDIVRDRRTGGFGYEPSAAARAREVINAELEAIGIDKTLYNIITPF